MSLYRDTPEDADEARERAERWHEDDHREEQRLDKETRHAPAPDPGRPIFDPAKVKELKTEIGRLQEHVTRINEELDKLEEAS